MGRKPENWVKQIWVSGDSEKKFRRSLETKSKLFMCFSGSHCDGKKFLTQKHFTFLILCACHVFIDQ